MVTCERKTVFDRASFWVRVYELPLKMMNEGIATKIGRKLGTLKEVYNNKSSWGIFLRMRVEIDITKTL